MKRIAVLILAGAVFAACHGGLVVQETMLPNAGVREPVAAPEVRVFFPHDDVPEHERIAVLDMEDWSYTTGRDAMVEGLRAKAAELGANAIVLDTIEARRQRSQHGGRPALSAVPIYIAKDGS